MTGNVNSSALWWVNGRAIYAGDLEKHWNRCQMVKPKHDPDNLPSASPGFRSVTPHDYKSRSADYHDLFLNYATALYSTRHSAPCLFVQLPSGYDHGSAIPSGSAMPTRPMDGLLIAKAFSSRAHIFAEDSPVIQQGINDGTYSAIPRNI